MPLRLIERLVDGSLSNLCTREYLSRTYLDLVSPPRSRVEGESTVAAARRNAREIAKRADKIMWSTGGAVTLRYQLGAKVHTWSPDATLAVAARKSRIFFELDRNCWQKHKARCEHYSRYLPQVYGQVFKDGFMPAVIFIVRHAVHRKRLRDQIGRFMAKGIDHDVLDVNEAGGMLAKVLFKESTDTSVTQESQHA
jgi:hypothetical protein